MILITGFQLTSSRRRMMRELMVVADRDSRASRSTGRAGSFVPGSTKSKEKAAGASRSELDQVVGPRPSSKTKITRRLKSGWSARTAETTAHDPSAEQEVGAEIKNRVLAYVQKVKTQFTIVVKSDALASAVSANPNSALAQTLAAANPSVQSAIAGTTDSTVLQQQLQQSFVMADFYSAVSQLSSELQKTEIAEQITQETNTALTTVALDPTIFIEGPPTQSGAEMTSVEVAVVGSSYATTAVPIATTTTPAPAVVTTTTTTAAPLLVEETEAATILGIDQNLFLIFCGAVFLLTVIGLSLYCYKLKLDRLRREEREEAERQARLAELRRLASLKLEEESSEDTFVAVIEEERKQAETEGRIPPPSLPKKFKMAKIRGEWDTVGLPRFDDEKSVYFNRLLVRDTLRAKTIERFGKANSSIMLREKDVPKEVFEVATSRDERKNARIWDIPAFARKVRPVLTEYWNWRPSYSRQVAPDAKQDTAGEFVPSPTTSMVVSAGETRAVKGQKPDYDPSSAAAGTAAPFSKRVDLLAATDDGHDHLSPEERAAKAAKMTAVLRHNEEARRTDGNRPVVAETVAGERKLEDTVTPKGKRKKHKKIVHY
ncbi:unnamed protein product [Amoebophrya sp. A120]|nr:unnamed protein product [Amoebophrya sp. A120]|eukprot:GSA120T00012432001.1